MGFKIPQGERGLMSDKRIKELIANEEMITNIITEAPNNDEKIISSGVSSYGFDATLAPEISKFYNLHEVEEDEELDPKNATEFPYYTETIYNPGSLTYKKYHVIKPHEFLLARTNEYFKIPRNVLAICMGKSTYARCGIIVNVTPLEPEWEGHVTLEITNTSEVPVRLYFNEGICQFLFFENEPCETTYKDKNGKYQGQTGITLSK